MKPPVTVAILGVGLIGGSIGLAVRQRGLANRVIGIGRSRSRLNRALRLGAITESTTSLARGVANADLIVVCTPVDCIVDHVEQVSGFAPEGAVITDVGSTKESIVAALDGKRSGAQFLGSHPLAGNDQGGVSNSTADLFQDRTVVVTPTKNTNSAVRRTVIELWKTTGATVVTMSAMQHDRTIAVVSHMPHAVATVLAGTPTAVQRKLAASGFEDTTRIASADPDLWLQIMRDNSAEVLRSLDQFMKNLEEYRSALKRGDYRKLKQYLKRGKQARESLGS